MESKRSAQFLGPIKRRKTTPWLHFSSLILFCGKPWSRTRLTCWCNDRQLLGTAVPTARLLLYPCLQAKINDVKKINITFQWKAQHAVLMTCSSGTMLHQFYINMLNLTLMLGRYTLWFLLQIQFLLCPCAALQSEHVFAT